MNSIKGEVVSIEQADQLSVIRFTAGQEFLTAIIIGTQVSHLKNGSPVQALFKETEVFISSQEDIELSVANRIPGRITKISEGTNMCKVQIETSAGILSSIFLNYLSQQMQLEVDQDVIAWIKSNEIMLLS